MADAAAAQERHLGEQAAAREQRDKQILAADAAGNPNVKVEAQMIRRDEEDNRRRWSGTLQLPAAYDSQWKGQNVTVVGTISRVEIDSKGFPQWVSIYFKESPDATFVVCSPYADLFQERVGLNLTALVGKTFEAAGPVESPQCGPKAPRGAPGWSNPSSGKFANEIGAPLALRRLYARARSSAGDGRRTGFRVS